MSGPLVVIGDSMLDIDIVGTVDRLAPDAPVPVVARPVEHTRPGGAALCARLAAEISGGNGKITLITPIADDAAGKALTRLVTPWVDLVAIPWTGSTPVKSRIRAGDHPVARVDRGGGSGTIGPLPDAAEDAIRSAGAILVADYGNGAAGDRRLRGLIRKAAGGKPVVWDPHPRGPVPVKGITLVTPNGREAGSTGRGRRNAKQDSVRAIHQLSARLRDRWSVGAVAITLGAEGVLLNLGTSVPLLVAAPRAATGDACGAGDCFAVTAALELARGLLPTEAVVSAVGRASEFVAAGGAAAAGRRWQEGESAPRSPAQRNTGPASPDAAVTDLESARALAQSVRSASGTVVATGGCFDLLHAGHVATLEAARRLGDCLIVCLNSDASVRRLKGLSRPLQPAADRARILRALRCVDAVVEFGEDTPVDVLSRLRPDLWVKGGDYDASSLPEADVLAWWGGQVVAVPYIAERSTSSLVVSAREGVSVLAK